MSISSEPALTLAGNSRVMHKASSDARRRIRNIDPAHSAVVSASLRSTAEVCVASGWWNTVRLRGACADLWSCQPGWVQANQIRKRFALHRGRGIELRLLNNSVLACFPAIIRVDGSRPVSVFTADDSPA